MIRPSMPPRIEQRYGVPCSIVNGCNIGPFVPIAENAAVGQILKRRITSVFAAYDVIDLMSESGSTLRVQAVFAPIFGTQDDLPPQGFR